MAAPRHSDVGDSTATDVAADRLRFLTAEPVDPSTCASPILASWRRSRDLKVAADRIELAYLPDPDLDTPLTRSAAAGAAAACASSWTASR